MHIEVLPHPVFGSKNSEEHRGASHPVWSFLLKLALLNAGRADIGWESGSRPMTILPAFYKQPWAASTAPDWRPNIHETHRDQVLKLPPKAALLASSAKTPNEIWSWGDNVLAVQGCYSPSKIQILSC